MKRICGAIGHGACRMIVLPGPNSRPRCCIDRPQRPVKEVREVSDRAVAPIPSVAQADASHRGAGMAARRGKPESRLVRGEM